MGDNREPYEILADAAMGIVLGGIGLVLKGTWNGARYLNGRRVSDCAGGCGRKIEFNVKQHGEGPHLCEHCAQRQEQALMTGKETTDTSFTMPGMGESIGRMGGYKGKYYGRKVGGRWILHCVVFHRDDTHTSWDYDPNTGEVSNLHARPDNLKEMR